VLVDLGLLAPLSLRVRGAARLSLSAALQDLGRAATAAAEVGGGGAPAVFSFSRLLRAAGVAAAGSGAFSAYADVARLLGTQVSTTRPSLALPSPPPPLTSRLLRPPTQTAALRLPFDATGDLIAWWAYQVRAASDAAASASASASPAPAAASASCCCGGAAPSPAPELPLASRLAFPTSPPFSSAFGLAKLNESGLLQPDRASLALLACRMQVRRRVAQRGGRGSASQSNSPHRSRAALPRFAADARSATS
jgi:hypothetical protein